jgi:hypothetical protein
MDARSALDRPLPRCYHGLACEPLDRSAKVHPRDVRVPLRRRQMRMARERLHGRRRDSSSKKRGDEVVAKVVQTKGLHPDALACTRERLTKTPLAPRSSLLRSSDECLAIALACVRERREAAA